MREGDKRSPRPLWLKLAGGLLGAVGAAALFFHFGVLEGLPAHPEPVTRLAEPGMVEQIEEARALLAPLLARYPSVSVAAAANGRLIWSEARGWADLGHGAPATPATTYRIYSVSKPITAVAALRLAEQGRLALDAPIGELLPELPQAVRPITPRQLAGHLSGIRHYREGEISAWGASHCASVAEALPFFLDNEPLAAEPGASSSYSSYAYVLLSRVVEVAAGRSFVEAIDELVLVPAGMRDTRLDDPRTAVPSRAEFYIPMWLGRVMADPDDWDNTCKWGAGGLLSTSEDLVRFALAVTGPTLLSAEGRATLFTAMKTTAGEETTSGFGFGVGTDDDGERVAAVSGGAMGARAALYLRLDEGVAVALLANVIDDRLTDEAASVARLFGRTETRSPAGRL